jgi:2-polyprenyl-3-methyl-5-hydroxy-6-metoxy-1,4-benzoquinol methylase
VRKRRAENRRLLDVGCGDGSFTAALKEAGCFVEASGVEIAAEAVAAAQQKGIKASQLDIEKFPLPFDDGCFDVVYCGEVIEHVFNPDFLLDELYRVLKPGGNCIITTPNMAGWPSRMALLFGFQPYATAVSPNHESVGKLLIRDAEGQWGHIRVFTLRAFKELVMLHQFKIERLQGCPVMVSSHLPFIVGRLVRTVDRLMSKRPSLAGRTIAVLRKEGVSGSP